MPGALSSINRLSFPSLWLLLFWCMCGNNGYVLAEEPKDCPLADYRLTNTAQLKRILEAHARWMNNDPTGQKANLCRAHLVYGKLSGVSLHGANLSGADLFDADLSGATLSTANLNKANLIQADLSKAVLINTILSEAELVHANLSGANLRGALLSRAKLVHAKLIEADLSTANLNEAEIFNANLFRAKVQGTVLAHAFLVQANLSWANLTEANLSDANLTNANLTGANLRDSKSARANLNGANLTGANLTGADLSGSDFNGAQMTDAIFEPKSLPETNVFSHADDLSAMRYTRDRRSLAILRQAFQKDGMREQEREVTYALKHSDRLVLWEKNGLGEKMESVFNLALFEWPSAYGMYPGRPLRILSGLILVFSVPYMIALSQGRKIKVVWPKDLIRDDDPFAKAGKSVPARANLFFPQLQRKFSGTVSSRFIMVAAITVVGVYFSLLSSFHIGWREFSFGTWLSRIQPREYTLVATGWVRIVSGVQSVLSVYLLALWVLTYFGHPFE